MLCCIASILAFMVVAWSTSKIPVAFWVVVLEISPSYPWFPSDSLSRKSKNASLVMDRAFQPAALLRRTRALYSKPLKKL